MKIIIKKWLEDHRIRWKEDEYKIPEERIDLLITMLKSRENDNLQQERERIIKEIEKMEIEEVGNSAKTVEQIIKTLNQ